jgi:hypothetical protein
VANENPKPADASKAIKKAAQIKNQIAGKSKKKKKKEEEEQMGVSSDPRE